LIHTLSWPWRALHAVDRAGADGGSAVELGRVLPGALLEHLRLGDLLLGEVLVQALDEGVRRVARAAVLVADVHVGTVAPRRGHQGLVAGAAE